MPPAGEYLYSGNQVTFLIWANRGIFKNLMAQLSQTTPGKSGAVLCSYLKGLFLFVALMLRLVDQHKALTGFRGRR